MINKEKKILQLGLNKSKFPEFSALDNDQKLFFSEIWLFNKEILNQNKWLHAYAIELLLTKMIQYCLSFTEIVIL